MRGKVKIRTRNTVLYKDHPRLCGEKHALQSDLFVQQGSPPPMRGKVAMRYCASSMTRITPAYAGKSS